MGKKCYSKIAVIMTCILIVSLIKAPFVISYAAESSLEKTDEKLASRNIEEYEGNEILVQMVEGSTKKLELKGCQIEELMEGMYFITVDSKEILADTLNRLEADNEVAYIQPNYTYHVLDIESMVEIPSDITEPEEETEEEAKEEDIPNDMFFLKQWGLYNTGTELFGNIQSLEGIDMNVLPAWEIYKGTEEVIVAVIDTGVDYKHEDLKNNMWMNTKEIPDNGIDDDGNGYIDDVYGWDFYNDDNTVCHYGLNGKKHILDDDDHGTHCAGAIAAEVNNEVGLAGVASVANVKIMPLKILGGKEGTASTDEAIRAIQYAVRMGADIISASWGASESFDYDKVLLSAIQTADILFVTAAGNDGMNNDRYTVVPACYSYLDNVITIGSADCDGTMSSFSNYGQSVDVLAPGGTIASTIVGSYANMSGTSMAAPMAAGVAALIYGTKKNLYPRTVKSLMLSSYQELPYVDKAKVSHAGMLDAYAAMSNLDNLEVDTKAPTFTTLKAGAKGILTIETSDTSGNGSPASGVCSVLIAKGKRSKAYFKHGTNGSEVTGTTFTTKSSGVFTVYIKDYAGNETVKTITSDKEAPIIKTKVTKSNTTRKVTVTVTDEWSGLSKVRYASGRRSASYFEKGSKGSKITISNHKGSFSTKKAGTYTIYAIDKLGNQIVKTITVK